MERCKRPTQFRPVLMLACFVMAFATGVPTVSADEPGPATMLAAAVNDARENAGLAPLAPHWDLVDDAEAHARAMAADRDLHHNPDLGGVTSGWQALGENVGAGPDIPTLHRAFMDSPPHRANVLGDWSHIGVGATTEGSTLWVVVIFMRAPAGTEPAEPAPTQPAWAEHMPTGPVVYGAVDRMSGRWHLRRPGAPTTSFYYGNPGDYPLLGDWDCDGEPTAAVQRDDGWIHVRNGAGQGVADLSFLFGDPGDVALAGDLDGDGCDTVSLYRRANDTIYVADRLGPAGGGLGAADRSFRLDAGDGIPFLGDFDGDGVDTIAVYDRANSEVSLRDREGRPAGSLTVPFGAAGWLLAADWTGTGHDAVAGHEPDTGLLVMCPPPECGGPTTAPLRPPGMSPGAITPVGATRTDPHAS